MKLTSYGGADGVTGSKHLVEFGGVRILLDCGLFQGLKLHRERNWLPLPFDAASLDAVVLSHAHLDHSGLLPVLVKHGYRGPVYASTATRDLADVQLRDSAHLQEEDAPSAPTTSHPRCRFFSTARWRSLPPKSRCATASCCACSSAKSTASPTACASSKPARNRSA